MATILVYLSTPVKGGETIFPDALISKELHAMNNNNNQNIDLTKSGNTYDDENKSVKQLFLESMTASRDVDSTFDNDDSNLGSSLCAQNRLHVKAKEGDAILFWSVTAGGELDRGSKHGSCPVVEVEKSFLSMPCINIIFQ